MGCCQSRDTLSDYNHPANAKTPLLDAADFRKQEEEKWKTIIKNASNMMINTTNNDGNYNLLPQEVERRSKRYKSILRKSKVVPIYSSNVLSNSVESTPYELLLEAKPYGGLSPHDLEWLHISVNQVSAAKKRLVASLQNENISGILISMKRIEPPANKKANPNRRSYAAA